MAVSPRRAPEVWEKISDGEEEERSSTTTVLVDTGVGAQAWTPSVNGALGGRHAQGTPRQSTQVNYADHGDDAWSSSEWSWTWTSREPDYPEGHDRVGVRAEGQDAGPTRLGLAALRPDSAHQPRQGDQASESRWDEGKRETGSMASQQFLKLHSSFPPAFHAKPGESWKDYWRSVEFWLASEGAHLPPNVRAARLMQQMKERAGKIVNHLSVEDVSGQNGVELIKTEMEKSPIIRLLEHKEVDKKRQKFMRLSRCPHESLESYINRASIKRHENDQCQTYKVGSRFYLGHLMDGARLSRKDQALVRTTIGGLNEEMKVVITLFSSYPINSKAKWAFR